MRRLQHIRIFDDAAEQAILDANARRIGDGCPMARHIDIVILAPFVRLLPPVIWPAAALTEGLEAVVVFSGHDGIDLGSRLATEFLVGNLANGFVPFCTPGPNRIAGHPSDQTDQTDDNK